jgi:hypothetical protein
MIIAPNKRIIKNLFEGYQCSEVGELVEIEKRSGSRDSNPLNS